MGAKESMGSSIEAIMGGSILGAGAITMKYRIQKKYAYLLVVLFGGLAIAWLLRGSMVGQGEGIESSSPLSRFDSAESSHSYCVDSVIQSKAERFRKIIDDVDTVETRNYANRLFLELFPDSFAELRCLFGSYSETFREHPRAPKWEGGNDEGPLREEAFRYLDIYRGLQSLYGTETLEKNIRLGSTGYFETDVTRQLLELIRQDMHRRPEEYLRFLARVPDSMEIGFWKYVIDTPPRLNRRRFADGFQSLIEEREPHSSLLEQAFDESNVEWGDIVDTVRLSDGIDSVEVTCLYFGKHREFRVNLSETHFGGYFFHSEKGYSFHSERKRFTISSLERRNYVINYINKLYIKKEKIILSKRKADEGMVSDYPLVKPQLFKKGKLFFEYKREPGSDSYTMEYNPEFNKRMISDYPVMIVKLFKKGNLVYEQENQIGSATHIIEYNHKFTGLYESLDRYVKQKPIMEDYESLRRSAKE